LKINVVVASFLSTSVMPIIPVNTCILCLTAAAGTELLVLLSRVNLDICSLQEWFIHFGIVDTLECKVMSFLFASDLGFNLDLTHAIIDTDCEMLIIIFSGNTLMILKLEAFLNIVR
jgi:hypothetical protein